MDQLIKLVTEKAGISETQAKTAVDTVMGFVKDKLPAVGGQLDGLMSGNIGDAAKGLADKLPGGIGNMFK
jgi:hypothetical protein